jgi:hypothetical protein
MTKMRNFVFESGSTARTKTKCFHTRRQNSRLSCLSILNKMEFPILSYEEAITNCRELFNVNIAEEDLRKPTVSYA